MSEESTIGAVLRGAGRHLVEAGVETPELDARLLLSDALGLDAAMLVFRREAIVPDEARRVFATRLARRAAGEPVHRILGRRAFYAHDFLLSPATLEPRPDTETLVEFCRAPIAACIERCGACTFADVGTGTGAIAVSLLALFPEATALAIDISSEALDTAHRNAEAAGVAARFVPLHGDHLKPVSQPVDLVVSNPPYIPTGDIVALAREVREHDPILALDGGSDGLRSYRAIAADAPRVLVPGGIVALEIGIGQGPEIAMIFDEAGFRLDARACDYGGIERVLLFRWEG